jgi:hypothetical protein
MDKKAGMYIVVGLVLVAAYLWITGAFTKAGATTSTQPGASGVGLAQAASGGLLGLESLFAPLTSALSGVNLNNATPAQLQTLQSQINLEESEAPITNAGTSQGAYLPAAPPPTIPISADLGTSNVSGGSFDPLGGNDVLTSGSFASLAAPTSSDASNIDLSSFEG